MTDPLTNAERQRAAIAKHLVELEEAANRLRELEEDYEQSMTVARYKRDWEQRHTEYREARWAEIHGLRIASKNLANARAGILKEDEA